MKKLHIFTARGEPVASLEALQQRIRQLESDNERLQRLVTRQMEQMRWLDRQRLPQPVKH